MRRFQAMKALAYQLEHWMLYWFYASSLITIWDSAFIFFRPQSLPGGKWANVFYPYKYYLEADPRYGDEDDPFVFTVLIMNIAEVILTILTIYLNHKKSLHTKPLAFTVSVMIFWKTTLYFIMFFELAGEKKYRKGTTLFQEVFYFLIPCGMWIVFPLMCVVNLWQDYLHDYSKKRY